MTNFNCNVFFNIGLAFATHNKFALFAIKDNFIFWHKQFLAKNAIEIQCFKWLWIFIFIQ